MNAMIHVPYDVTKYRVRRNHTVYSIRSAVSCMSTEQHAHFRGELRTYARLTKSIATKCRRKLNEF